MKFFGLANKQDPLTLAPGTLKQAINVDVDDKNSIRRRKGFVLTQTFTTITASYTQRDQSDAYLVADGSLLRLSDGALLADEMGGSPYVFDDSADTLFVMGERKLMVARGSPVELVIPTCPQPSVVRMDGDMPKGLYRVTAVYRCSATGRVGPASPPVVLSLSDKSNLLITVEPLEGYTVAFYITPPNGEEMYHCGRATDGVMYCNRLALLGAVPFMQQLLGAEFPVNGYLLQHFKTRLYVAEFLVAENRTVVWFSWPHSFHLFTRHQDYFVVEGKILAMVDVGEALVLATATAIYFYDGVTLIRGADYGVPAGVPYGRSQTGIVWMYTNKGICQLNPFKNVIQETYDLPVSTTVNSVVVEQDGYERLVTLLNDSSLATNTFRS